MTAGRLADPAAGAQRAQRSFRRGKATTAVFFARPVLQPVAAHRPRGRCPHDGDLLADDVEEGRTVLAEGEVPAGQGEPAGAAVQVPRDGEGRQRPPTGPSRDHEVYHHSP
ncbi:hypothetical protein ACFVTP_18780 [Streptomyces celluloflavus]|uniref:hypothetical protein n=1 Tax=Streptomyces celluloflavus TaxID=58344 RepID=UPI0036DCA956